MRKPNKREASRITVMYFDEMWMCPWFETLEEAKERVRILKYTFPNLLYRYLKTIGYD